MQEMEILKILNLMLGASIILLCLLIFVIAGVITYYLKFRKVDLDNFQEETYKSLSNK